MVVARELTKMHEEFLRGTVAEVRSELAARDRIRGEITLLVEAPARNARRSEHREPEHRAHLRRGNRSPPVLRACRPKAASTKRKHSSAWRANWANQKANSIASCSANGPGGGEPDLYAFFATSTSVE